MLPNKKSNGLSVVIGSTDDPSQMRRHFNTYIRESRAEKHKPFLHYNSWFDFASWQEPDPQFHYRIMNEKICLDRVQSFGEELIKKRGVKMDSLMWDDGWDNQYGARFLSFR
jgi:hypothetical protein